MIESDARTDARPDVRPTGPPPFSLNRQQIRFFDTFGFLHLPRLFLDEVESITAGFHEVFMDEGHDRWETNDALHYSERRVIIPMFVEKSPKLEWLKSDPRVSAITQQLLGAPSYRESDGNLFDCDSAWHPDTFGIDMRFKHIKLSFYLDQLAGDSGAIRMIPGSHIRGSDFHTRLTRDLETQELTTEAFGVDPKDIPSWTVHTRPGDLVVWNFQVQHASFGGQHGRRLFSMNYMETDPATLATVPL